MLFLLSISKVTLSLSLMVLEKIQYVNIGASKKVAVLSMHDNLMLILVINVNNIMERWPLIR